MTVLSAQGALGVLGVGVTLVAVVALVALSPQAGCARGSDKINCGDGELQAGEECDATNLNGFDCQRLGLEPGELACTDRCNFDIEDCGPCARPCASLGVTRCNDGTVETCGIGPTGCQAWETTADCKSASQVCDSSSGTAQCVAP